MSKYDLIATTSFGLESIVKGEAIRLGFENINVSDGKVEFTGDETTIAKANLWMRSADRILLKVGEFKALSFEELFEQTKSLNWGDYIPSDGIFPVIGKSVKSQLFSISDCQAIVKKAVVEKLKIKYNVDWFQETGATYKIQVALLRDIATITLDTSGTGLHKRGYRDITFSAPLKETLAAALVDITHFRKNNILTDPFCGTGTIPIEAAMKAKNIAPGLQRDFISEEWEFIPKNIWKDARKEAYSLIDNDIELNIKASDIDPQAIKLAKLSAEKAGVDDCITFEVKSFEDIEFNIDGGTIICNPPYGERLGDLEEVEQIYLKMSKVFTKNETWSFYVLTSYESFETLIGYKANARRKLFNGMIKVDYYQYFGKRPKKKND